MNNRLFIVGVVCVWTATVFSMVDVSLVGYINPSDGIGGISLLAAKAIEGDFSYAIQSSLEYPIHNSKFSFYSHWVWDMNRQDSVKYMPNSKIRIAFSMLESTKIPPQWTNIFNNNFDMVLVPDEFLVEVYKNSGVRVPIFVFPYPMDLEPYLSKRIKLRNEKQYFVFGTFANLLPRKNIDTLLNAFAIGFRGDPKFKLIIHAKAVESGCEYLVDRARKIPNVELTINQLPRGSTVDLMQEIDCYVQPSRGEGFSLCPREAMALGIPCVLSDNTAQKTICKVPGILGVPSVGQSVAHYKIFDQDCGSHFEIKVQGLVDKMRFAYHNHSALVAKYSQYHRNWVSQYDVKNIKPLFTSLFRPMRLVLGSYNLITPECITTTSESLFNKYNELRVKEVDEATNNKDKLIKLINALFYCKDNGLIRYIEGLKIRLDHDFSNIAESLRNIIKTGSYEQAVEVYHKYSASCKTIKTKRA